jgi:hypothetical protein
MLRLSPSDGTHPAHGGSDEVAEMPETGRTAPPRAAQIDPAASFPLFPTRSLPAPPEGLGAVNAALDRGSAVLADALAALDRAARLLDDQRRLVASLADPTARPEERLAAIRGFAAARLRLRAVTEGVPLLSGGRGLRLITGLDGGAISVAAVDLRPVFAAIAEAPSPRVAAAMLAPEGAIAEAARRVAQAQRRFAADQRRVRNRQCLNAALALAWGEGAVAPPPSLLGRLAAFLRDRRPG